MVIDKLVFKKRYAEITCKNVVYDRLNIKTLLEYRINQGDDVDYKRFRSFLNDSDAANAKEYAFSLLAIGAKTQKELRQKLKERGHFAKSIENAIAAVAEYGYLDDKAYAKNYIDCKSGGKGSLRLKYELKGKGVSEAAINNAFAESNVNELENCKSVIKKLLNGDLNDAKYRDKLMHKLAYRGFSFEIIKKALECFKVEIDEFYE